MRFLLGFLFGMVFGLFTLAVAIASAFAGFAAAISMVANDDEKIGPPNTSTPVADE